MDSQCKVEKYGYSREKERNGWNEIWKAVI